ncbi:toll/interleukin-1 receptor domain-containing protein [Streptomyces sp. HC44]|uniref:Toll/interleukin-1 receptor domain-containing protein n=1 Tax=Streptomyces scabichelini TaxID=2711217 RepID=A0A6G4VB81_9ACTN|nr:toll/interleukin-1 receptor domain-containing protein [Streptomyces scabichelini]NGO11316.1 toll/interleukin-1 receptor domain-containing protein [Streptomyces scabichelini]
MPHIFINYRTGDGEQVATTLDSVLKARFGKERIYRASRSIAPGAFFDDDLIRNVRRTGVLLAVMGPGWAAHPALRREDDWVRKEILEALRCGIPVIPVLVGRRTERPTKADLPEPLARIADCQSLRYDHQNHDTDVQRIGDALADQVPELAAADRDVSETSAPGSVRNTARDVHDSTLLQTGPVNGDAAIKTNGPHSPIRIGPGDTNHHSVHQAGDGANYVAGGNEGGIHQNFGASPRRERREDEER